MAALSRVVNPAIGRRKFLALGVGAVAATAKASAPHDTLSGLDATALAALVRKGEVRPVELVERAIAAIERVNPRLNAVIWRDDARAHAQARRPIGQRPFEGVPYLVKNTQEYVGFPVTRSCRFLRDHISTSQSAFSDAIDSTGAIALGLTNVPELALLASTEPVMYGATANPWDPTRSPSGSSGGSAAAVATGLVPFATASDGAGSIRGPASHCGLFGFKGSRAVERAADDEFTTFRGCLSRSVRDTAAFFAATQAPDPIGMTAPGFVSGPSDRRLRIAFSTRSHMGAEPDADVARATRDTAALLADLGHHVEECWFPVDGETFTRHFLTLWGLEPALYVEQARQRLNRVPDEAVFEPWLLGLAALYSARPLGALEAAYGYFREFQQRFRRFLNRYDVYVTPVHASPPISTGEQAGTVPFERLLQRVLPYAAYAPSANLAGVPSMSVPLHWTASGLPVGTMMTARFGGDRLLLELAYSLERARPWARRLPPIRAWAAI